MIERTIIEIDMSDLVLCAWLNSRKSPSNLDRSKAGELIIDSSEMRCSDT